MEKGFMEGCEKFPQEGSSVEERITAGEQLIDYHKGKIKELEEELSKLCDEESYKLSADYVGKCYQFDDTYRKVLAVKVINAEKVRISYQTILRASLANHEIESYISSTLMEKGKKLEGWFGKQITHQTFMEAIQNYCRDLTNRLNLDNEVLQKRFYSTCQ